MKMNLINRMKGRGRNMIISVNGEKAFDKILYSFIIKTLNKLVTDENCFSVIEGICENPPANFIHSGTRPNFASKTRSRCVHIHHFMALEVLSRATR